MYFEIYQETGALAALFPSGAQWRWRLKGGNHETLASGESYVTRGDCEHVVDLIKQTTFATPVHAVQG